MSVNEVKLKSAPVKFQIRGTGPATSRTFAIGDEDHTIGNAVRHILMQDARVGFAGYSVPHPSEPLVQIRVQTNPGSDCSAVSALKDACQTLDTQCADVMGKLEALIPEVKQDREEYEALALLDGFEDNGDAEMQGDENEMEE